MKECSRDAGRTPMQWSSDKHGGFSTSQTTWLPVNANYPQINVDNQLSSFDIHNTHLYFYIDVSKVRKLMRDSCGASPYVDASPHFSSPDVLVVKRKCAVDECFFLIISLSKKEEVVDLMPMAGDCGLDGREMFVMAKSVGGINVYGEIVDMQNIRMGKGEAVIIH